MHRFMVSFSTSRIPTSFVFIYLIVLGISGCSKKKEKEKEDEEPKTISLEEVRDFRKKECLAFKVCVGGNDYWLKECLSNSSRRRYNIRTKCYSKLNPKSPKLYSPQCDNLAECLKYGEESNSFYVQYNCAKFTNRGVGCIRTMKRKTYSSCNINFRVYKNFTPCTKETTTCKGFAACIRDRLSKYEKSTYGIRAQHCSDKCSYLHSCAGMKYGASIFKNLVCMAECATHYPEGFYQKRVECLATAKRGNYNFLKGSETCKQWLGCLEKYRWPPTPCAKLDKGFMKCSKEMLAYQHDARIGSKLAQKVYVDSINNRSFARECLYWFKGLYDPRTTFKIGQRKGLTQKHLEWARNLAKGAVADRITVANRCFSDISDCKTVAQCYWDFIHEKPSK